MIEVLREIDSQMRREWPYRRLMLEPLEVAGVDAFTESRRRHQGAHQGAAPASSGRWRASSTGASRSASTSSGIEIPVPQQAVYVADDQREPSRPPRTRPEIVRAEVRGSEG